MPVFSRSEADRLAESIALNQKIVTRLLVEREQINRSVTHYQAELDWLYRCKEFIGGSNSHDPQAVAKDAV